MQPGVRKVALTVHLVCAVGWVGAVVAYLAAALHEMRRVLRPGGTLLVAEAQVPRHGRGWRLLARLHGFGRMAGMLPRLEPLAVQAGFGQMRAGEAPPWLRYIAAVKTAPAT